MKKLLLGLGTMSLITLPLLTIASCSSSSTPTFETEKAKLVSQKTLITTGTAAAAKLAITSAQNKNTELAKYYKEVPLADGFTYTYESSEVNTNGTTLNVTVKINQKENTNTDTAVISITGFNPETIFEKEARKLVTKATLPTAETAAAAIIALDGSSPEPLDTYYAPITLSTDFTYAYKSSAVDSNNTRTLNVIVTITKSGANSGAEDAMIIITGFAASDMSAEEGKLVTKATLIPLSTATAAMNAIEAGADANAQNVLLNNYYAPITLADGFTYIYKSSVVDGTDTGMLNVTVTITQTAPGASNIPTPVDKVIGITGFAESTMSVEAARLSTQETILPLLSISEAKAALDGSSPEPLDTYYAPITLADGFTYAYKSSAIDSTTITTLNVTVTITQIVGSGAADETFDKVIPITNFPLSNMAAQKNLLITPLATQTGSVTATEAMTAINAGSTPSDKNTLLDNYYSRVILAGGFTYAYTSSSVSGTTLEVIVTITQVVAAGSVADQTDTKTIIINGFDAS